jgi:cytochrome c oxidase subunit II
MDFSFATFFPALKEAFFYGLPKNISTHGAEIDRLMAILHWFMLLLFVGWGIYLVYVLIKFRERAGHTSDPTPRHFSIPKYIEVGIVLVELFLLVALSGPIWARVKNDLPGDANAMQIRITAEQFAWNVHYPGRDGKFGARKTELIDGTNPLGLDREDPDAKDDIFTINQLNVPINKPVKVILTSKDVIHSFYLPNLRVKQDAVPGMEVNVGFQATEEGEFQIQCAQLCGVGHYRMGGMFTSLSPEKYEAWFAEEEKNLDLGGAPTGE